MKRRDFSRTAFVLLSLTLIAVLAFSLGGCRRRKKRAVQEEESTGLATVVHVADPRSAVQLVRGFHSVEANAWRWTMARFAVILHPPKDAARKGATLELKFSLPEIVVQKLGKMTVAATVNGLALASQSYDKPGEYTYSADVAPSALVGDAVTVDFTVDKALPPTDQDLRELALIVSTIGFQPKQ